MHPCLTRGQTKDSTGDRVQRAVFMQQATFPVAAVRFPIVLGTDDYTKRLHFHIEHIREGREIGVPNSAAHISFIRSDEAADFLLWLSGTWIQPKPGQMGTRSFP